MKRSGLLFGILLGLTLTLSSEAADWPQWQGPDRDNVSKEKGLLKKWPEGGPTRVWLNRDAGLGYGGFAVADGRLYTMGAKANTEFLLALDANTGKELWRADIGELLKNDWGNGPRGTPSVDGDRIYTISGQGNIVCASARDGKIIWRKTMQELGGTVPGWGYTESPLVEGNSLYCTPGGEKGTLASLDKMTGKVNWQSKDFTVKAHYSSIIAADHNGTRQLIQLTERNLVGVDSKNGNVLWKADWNGRTAVIPTPIFHNGYVYATSGYGTGCKLVKIGPGNKVEEIYDNKVMKNHHGGVALVDGHVYGYSDGVGWTCQNFLSGEEVWASEKLGKGAMSVADGMLYCLEEDTGTVLLAEASPKGWNEQGRFKLAPQTQQRSNRGKIWTHPVIADGKLYLRDQELLFCFDVSGGREVAGR